MKLRAAAATRGVGDMLPLMNVVLLLLAFFMMLAGLAGAAPAGALPRSATAAVADAHAPLLQIDRDGQLRLDGRRLDDAELKSALRAAVGGTVRVHAPPDASASRVLAVLQLLHDADARRVQLLVRRADR